MKDLIVTIIRRMATTPGTVAFLIAVSLPLNWSSFGYSQPPDRQPGAPWVEPVTGMEFVFVKGGCYKMGCGRWTSECAGNELPVHNVCLNDFWIGKYEVTQGQYQKIMDSNPAAFQKGDNYPVENVSWDDAHTFLQSLNEKTGITFRLPTEAEWEYAARSGGKEEKYSGGKDLSGFSWCSFNSEKSTHAVGVKAPNGLGIFDMSGNVSEWVEDWYNAEYYTDSPKDNPKGPANGPGRVIRGGCWGNTPGFLRVAARDWSPPDSASETTGFRLVLPATPPLSSTASGERSTTP